MLRGARVIRTLIESFPVTLPVALTSAALLLWCPPVFAFTDEVPTSPAGGQRVSNDVTFFIDADGHPEALETYRIEVASDSDFKKIVKVFDMAKNKAGWSLGDLRSLEEIPEEERPKNFRGIHLRAFQKLTDGSYFWRALKSTNGGPYQPLRGVESFVVDTVPPQAVDTLRLRLLEDGRLQMYWSDVTSDRNGELETAGGYRVYRFNKVLKRFPTMTRNLAAETQDTQLVLPGREDTNSITFYFVNAVDVVGNEQGRKRAAPIGSFEVAFNPPDVRKLTNPKYLKRLADEARAAEEARK